MISLATAIRQAYSFYSHVEMSGCADILLSLFTTLWPAAGTDKDQCNKERIKKTHLWDPRPTRQRDMVPAPVGSNT